MKHSVSKQCAAECVRRLSTLKWFPMHAGDVVADEIARFCWSDDHARAMTRRVLGHCDEWPSIVGLHGNERSTSRTRLLAKANVGQKSRELRRPSRRAFRGARTSRL